MFPFERTLDESQFSENGLEHVSELSGAKWGTDRDETEMARPTRKKVWEYVEKVTQVLTASQKVPGTNAA